MCSQRHRKLAIVFQLALAAVLLTLPLVTASASSGRVPSQGVSQDLEAMLSDYSQYLSSGRTDHAEHYSPQMAALAKDRRQYYAEFFAKGLHCNLDRVESQFVTDGATVAQNGNVVNVRLSEIVTMYGQPITISPDQYPLIQAARWALLQTSDASVGNALRKYIEAMTDGVAESVRNGVQITFVISHDIDVRVDGGHRQLTRDTFTDKATDNLEGFDNVSWLNGEATRHKSDLTRMPDSKIYNTSVEALGKALLADYTAAYSGVSPQGTGFYYTRSRAANYINSYTSNPTSICPGSGDVFQDKSKYNSAYSYLANAVGCNDCVDYVSQALNAGGFPTDSTWYPQIGSNAWLVTTDLRRYLVDSLHAATDVTSLTSLLVGDIAFTSTMSHGVMVGGVNPYRYSGHTNDRLLYPFQDAPTLTKYVHVYDYVP